MPYVECLGKVPFFCSFAIELCSSLTPARGYFRFPAVLALLLARGIVYQDFSLSGPHSAAFNASALCALLCMPEEHAKASVFGFCFSGWPFP